MFFPCGGDGEHRDPRGAQHPDAGRPSLHRHQLDGRPSMPGLFGPQPLPTLEGFPAGLVCCGRTHLLPACRRGGAQLRPAGALGRVSEGWLIY